METEQRVRVGVLSPGAYADVEKKAGGNTHVNTTTTELQAAYQLGVQHVLRILREGFNIT